MPKIYNIILSITPLCNGAKSGWLCAKFSYLYVQTEKLINFFFFPLLLAPFHQLYRNFCVFNTTQVKMWQHKKIIFKNDWFQTTLKLILLAVVTSDICPAPFGNLMIFCYCYNEQIRFFITLEPVRWFKTVFVIQTALKLCKEVNFSLCVYYLTF